MQVAAVDEAAAKQSARADGASADDTALMLAAMKAERVAHRDPEALVIGCDQLLVCGDRWFDKPPDLAEARRASAARCAAGRMNLSPRCNACAVAGTSGTTSHGRA